MTERWITLRFTEQILCFLVGQKTCFCISGKTEKEFNQLLLHQRAIGAMGIGCLL
jgi:hypothetical protein